MGYRNRDGVQKQRLGGMILQKQASRWVVLWEQRLGCMVLWESRYQGAWDCGSRNWGAWYFIEVAEIAVYHGARHQCSVLGGRD